MFTTRIRYDVWLRFHPARDRGIPAGGAGSPYRVSIPRVPTAVRASAYETARGTRGAGVTAGARRCGSAPRTAQKRARDFRNMKF